MPKPNKEQIETYQEILSFYDLTENIIELVEKGEVAAPEAHVPHVEELVENVEDSAKVLMDMLVEMVNAGGPLLSKEKRKAEMSVRRMQHAIERFKAAHKHIQHAEAKQ